MTAALFDTTDYGVEASKGLGADARRTIRRRNLLAAGTHPTTRRPLLDAEWGYTCRDCANCFAHEMGNRHWKCGAVPVTFGPATDVRLSWPACDRLVIS